MTRTRGLLLGVLAVLVAVWVSSSATMPMGSAPQREPALAPASGQVAVRSAFELDEVVQRLEQRMGNDPSVRPPVRNPFRFATETRAPREPAPAQPAATTVPAVASPVAPALTLIGVVDRTIDGRSVRIGVVSMSGKLAYAAAGDRVGAYEVVAVGADAIELKDTSNGTTLRLALR